MDIESGIIYNFFLIIACLLAFFTEKAHYNPLCLLLTYIFIVFFWAIRYKIGYDYEGYMEIFSDIKFGYNSYVEPGFGFLNKLFSFSPIGYVGVLSTMTAMSYFFLFKLFIREKILTYGIFFSMVFLLQFMLTNQVRQAFVLVYFLYIIHYLEEKKYLKYIFALLPMLLFHISAVFLMPFVFISKIRLNKIVWIILILSTYFMYLLGFFKEIGTKLMMIFPLYEGYKMTDRMLAEDVGFSIVMFFGICVALYLLVFDKSINRPVLMTVFLTGIVLYNIFIEFHLIGRVVFYLTYVNVLLASSLCKNNKVNGLPLICITFLFFLLLSGKEPSYHGTLPYQTIFEKNINHY
ncbi:MAG: EpsG family protein [Odoribacter sp.]